METQIFTTKKVFNLEILKKVWQNPKERLGLLGALILILVTAGALIFWQVQNSGTGKNKASSEKVFEKQDPTKQFDAVFLSFNQGKNAILVEVTKNGLTTRAEIEVALSVKVSRVVYETRTQVIVSRTNVNLKDLKAGESLRLVVKKADTKFNFEGLKEIQVLEGK